MGLWASTARYPPPLAQTTFSSEHDSLSRTCLLGSPGEFIVVLRGRGWESTEGGVSGPVEALRVACIGGNYEMVQYLLTVFQYTAEDVHIGKPSALYIACAGFSSNAEIVQLLVERLGLERADFCGEIDGYTLMHRVEILKRTDVLTYLVNTFFSA